jgi:protein-tyrosine phosphatase
MDRSIYRRFEPVLKGAYRVRCRAMRAAGAAGAEDLDLRLVPLSGSLNLRDLGGYVTASGRIIRWGSVFRSDSLHRCSAEDFEVLERMGIGSIYDLRRDEEVEQSPGPRTCVRIPVTSRRLADTDPATLRTAADAERWLYEDYCLMLAESGPAFGTLFSHLAAGARPSVFHCLGGKDRTGMAAALLLTLLGVDRERVLDDYELTNRCAGPRRLRHVVESFVEAGIGQAAAEALLSAPRWAMAAALEQLDSRYGGVEAYLLNEGRLTEAGFGSLHGLLLGRSSSLHHQRGEPL